MNSHQRRKRLRKWYHDCSLQIEEDKYGQGIFSTPYVMDGWSTWMDFRFLGEYEGRKRVWSVAMQNLYNAYYHAVEDVSLDQMREKFPEPEDWDPFDFNDPTKWKSVKGGKQLVGSLSYYNGEDYEWNKENVKRLMDSGDIKVGEMVEIHPEYDLSVGLWTTVNSDFIGPQDVIQFIESFVSSGYKEFTGPEEFSVTWAEFEEHHNKSKRVYE